MEENECLDDFEEPEEKKKIPWDKLLGVALLGAIGSALLYYVFIQLEEEKKLAVKETIVSFGKKAIAPYLEKMAHEEE